MRGKTLNVWLAAAATLIAGCGQKITSVEMPEVNNVNCNVEKIKQIADKEVREKFSGLCARQSGAIAPTEKPKNWLEMNDGKN